jgi:nitroreductase
VDLFEALYTTRSMRRVHPDPVPMDVQARMIDAAIRAPSGGNAQAWRFVFVDDPALRRELGRLYSEVWEDMMRAGYLDVSASTDPDGTARVRRSAQYLADHFADAPLLLLACSRQQASSIYPAVWSAMLAARAAGVGSTLTTILGVRAADVFALLGVPEGEQWTLSACVVLGYPRGRWGLAARRPAHEVAARNGWHGAPGFEAPDPLWSPS